MIQLKIVSVARRASSQVGTNRYTYPEGSPRVSQRFHGAEWEEVEFQLLEEEKPPIGVANIDGSAYLVGNVGRILLNDPALFGSFKIGDIVNFTPAQPTIETTASEVKEPPPPEPAPAPTVIETTSEPIVIPTIT